MDGRSVAAIYVFGSLEQVMAFEKELDGMGYRMTLLDDDAPHKCDFVFTVPKAGNKDLLSKTSYYDFGDFK